MQVQHALKKTLSWGLSLFMICLALSSCRSYEALRQESVYFNRGLDTQALRQYQLVEPVIQKGDLLQISIVSNSSSANALFAGNYAPLNPGAAGSGTPSAMAGAQQQQGYQVDISTGEIHLPLLGVIHADGMTKQQLQQEIRRRAAAYLKEDPIVNIQYLNLKVTVLGTAAGVSKVVTLKSERANIFDVLGEAGGTPVGSDIRNILVIREQNGERSFGTLDLTSGDIFRSPYFYLRQNDVIYIQPTKAALAMTDQTFMRKMQAIQIVQIGLFSVTAIFNIINLFR